VRFIRKLNRKAKLYLLLKKTNFQNSNNLSKNNNIVYTTKAKFKYKIIKLLQKPPKIYIKLQSKIQKIVKQTGYLFSKLIEQQHFI